MLRSFLVLFICCVGLSVAQLEFLLGDLDYPAFHQECGSNEVAMGCINPCPPEKTCQDRESYACLAVVVPCKFQCHCREGLIRKTEGGECIPEDECGTYCDRNQVYTDCKQSCLNQSCSAINELSNCVSEESEPCIPGCICKEGFYHRYEGDSSCIPRCYCPDMLNTQDC